jgi:pyruvate,orthophosphate dikinase
MIPIVITARELKLLRPNAEAALKKVFDKAGVRVPVKIGTMIEVPRAAIRSGHIAKYADFFSFGTNDLTQMTFAFSRDDVASFLPTYLNKNVLDVDPFKSIDEEGVGFLISNATGQGRAVNPDLKVGICGEHGGDPATIDFCYRSGLNYVSCSPFRVPLARLAGAQAVINNASKPAPTKKDAAPKKGVAKEAGAKALKDIKRPAAKQGAVKTSASGKKAVKKAAAPKKAVKAPKKPAAKQAVSKKPALRPAKKSAARKAVTKQVVAKKTGTAGKTLVKKTTAKSLADNKVLTKKSVAKKPAAVRKSPVKAGAKRKPALK